ncbi:ABC transporter ATP-binding protein [Roseomonas sp. JC162]|uniref:ABC transporter ATP-binding protein n=1 Tax=Neoroseomonas marina TaxID=1232220 RepID=A0A848EBT1_9PROT|nr:ABC transporter ATP-binding protein [Neoroseomonas marina]NMJ40735.1 ABC transporter ATP-binding protein [Neoroseomonas marina]
MSLLEIAQLTGGYGETDILNGIDLTVEQGEILTVAGTNGAGKSTLAKAVMGLLPRASGRIALDGTDILAEPVERRLALGIAYVPQVGNVFASLSVLENLQVVQGVRDAKARIAELLDAFPALSERRRARAGSLSGGERQQLAFARALMARPRLMILDEPTAALAPARVADSFERIRALPALGVSVLMVEQRARQALSVSDRGCILDGGKVAMLGAAAGLLADERAAALYLGRAGGA